MGRLGGAAISLKQQYHKPKFKLFNSVNFSDKKLYLAPSIKGSKNFELTYRQPNLVTPGSS
jgi:hypothetical protein